VLPTATTPTFPLTLALYAAACALYLGGLAGGAAQPQTKHTARLGRAARMVLLAAFLAHAVDIGLLCVRGTHPFVNVREVLSFLGWLSVGAYLVLTVRYALPLAGALVVPVTLVLDAAARVGPAPASDPGHAATALATIHIGLAVAGIAAFTVAAGDAIVYLFAEGQLKARRRVPAGVPSLQTLDRLGHRCVELGFPLFTVAMVTGAIWLVRLPDGGAHRLLQPQYALSAIAWALYAGLLVLRVVAGWRGRRAALVTLGGFAAALGVLVVYYVRGVSGGA
jgi:ABC-type uncharacterized transport system permease subunit